MCIRDRLRSATAWVTLVPVPVDSEPKNRPKQEPTIKAIRHISRMITTAIQPPAAMAAINPFTAAMVAFMAVAVTLTAALTPVTVAFAAALAAWAAAFAAFAVAWAVLCATLADLCAVLMLLAPCLTPFRVPVSYTHLDVYKRQVWKQQKDCSKVGETKTKVFPKPISMSLTLLS